jgi:hypothetical integral membrane protein (TIGR02206 family)
MKRYLAADYDGPPFKLFGVPHLVSLALILLVNVALLAIGPRYPAAWRLPTRIVLAVVLLGQEVMMHIWRISAGIWNPQENLPLHLCSLAVWLGGAMLLTKNTYIYEFMYLLGLPGALQALITPDAKEYGFPHFRFFQALLSHGVIVTAAVYMTTAESFRPVPMSILRILIFGHLYMLIVFVINRALGSNYMYVNRKPDTASIIDLMPPWPRYLLYIEGIAIVMVILLYLPFLVQDLGG